MEGRRAGEGYWSKDGRQLVFQSEREPGNPFYQIYLMDMASGDVTRMSPGMGKTTCSFINPETGDVLFASTHHDPRSKQLQDEELTFRASGKERRYSWDYDPEMELYVRNAQHRHAASSDEQARATTPRPAISPDGQWIVFSSTRDGYDRQLSAAEQKQLETRSQLLRRDLHHARRRRRLRRRGASPTFPAMTAGRSSHRTASASSGVASTRRGVIADVRTMNLDGTDERQITDFGAMSWAPYIHPSGQYVLFASNKLGFENFEVFMVDIDGKKEPVRVTYSDGFDGLPVPSPDGTQLAWTSSRGGGREGQIYLAQWNHQKALDAITERPGAKGSEMIARRWRSRPRPFSLVAAAVPRVAGADARRRART